MSRSNVDEIFKKVLCTDGVLFASGDKSSQIYLGIILNSLYATSARNWPFANLE